MKVKLLENLENKTGENKKSFLFKIFEVAMYGLAGGILVLMLGWIWDLKTENSDLRATTLSLDKDIKIVYGILADNERRATNNEVRSTVNQELKNILISLVSTNKSLNNEPATMSPEVPIQQSPIDVDKYMERKRKE